MSIKMKTSSGTTASLAEVGEYVYRITDLNASSSRYGNCEKCGMPVSSVYYIVEGRIYEPGEITHANCRSLFGHKECCESLMR